jgi:hypothetical protein
MSADDVRVSFFLVYRVKSGKLENGGLYQTLTAAARAAAEFGPAWKVREVCCIDFQLDDGVLVDCSHREEPDPFYSEAVH